MNFLLTQWNSNRFLLFSITELNKFDIFCIFISAVCREMSISSLLKLKTENKWSRWTAANVSICCHRFFARLPSRRKMRTKCSALNNPSQSRLCTRDSFMVHVQVVSIKLLIGSLVWFLLKCSKVENDSFCNTGKTSSTKLNWTVIWENDIGNIGTNMWKLFSMLDITDHRRFNDAIEKWFSNINQFHLKPFLIGCDDDLIRNRYRF